MAKDVIFDSERYEKQQSIKRWAIPLAALLGIIIIAAAIALILRSGRGKPIAGGEDTPYPYTWAVNRNGSVTLVLDRSAAPDFRWIAAGEDSLMSVETAQEDSLTRFTLTPLGEGRSILTFALCRAGDETDRIYELHALTETTQDGKTLRSAVLSVSGRLLQGTVRGGEGTDYPYMLFTDADGDLVLAVTDNSPIPEEETEQSADTKDGGWACVSENEAVAEVLGVIVRENTAAAYLRAGAETGTVRVRMADSVSGTEIVLELEADGSGALMLLEHSLRVKENG